MYSADVRKIAKRLYINHMSLRKVASIIGSSHSSIHRWLQYIPKTRKVQKTKLGDIKILDIMRLYIKTHPFCNVKDIQKIILDTFNLNVSNELVRLTINKTLLFTKKRSRYFSEPKNSNEKLKEFLEKREKFIQENRCFVSIDETSFGRNYLPAYGYAEKGKCLYIKRPYTRITTCSVVAAITQDKSIVFEKKDGSFDSISFCSFLQKLQYPAKTVIIMDNVAFHHSKIVKELIYKKGWEYLYTPPYSPVFNPIEGVFSIVKRHYSKCMDIVSSFNIVTNTHIKAFFKYSFNAISNIILV